MTSFKLNNIMSEFWIYFQIGLRHVLDIKAYDHVLFLIVLTVPYAFKDWKRVWKIELIEKFNPVWRDLHGEIDVVATLVEIK